MAKEQIESILKIQLALLSDLLADQGLSITVNSSARNLLAHEGYDPNYGARPLKRVLKKRLQNPLAKSILKNEFCSGDQILVSENGGDLLFNSDC